MSDPNVPPTPPSEPPAPPPPAAGPPPAPSGGGGGSDANNLMILLSYLYILAVVPLLVERDDADVQWHAKHGLLLLGLDILIGGFFFLLAMITGSLGCLLLPVQFVLHAAFFLFRLVCIIKGIGGERFKIPGISQLVDNF